VCVFFLTNWTFCFDGDMNVWWAFLLFFVLFSVWFATPFLLVLWVSFCFFFFLYQFAIVCESSPRTCAEAVSSCYEVVLCLCFCVKPKKKSDRKQCLTLTLVFLSNLVWGYLISKKKLNDHTMADIVKVFLTECARRRVEPYYGVVESVHEGVLHCDLDFMPLASLRILLHALNATDSTRIIASSSSSPAMDASLTLRTLSLQRGVNRNQLHPPVGSNQLMSYSKLATRWMPHNADVLLTTSMSSASTAAPSLHAGQQLRSMAAVTRLLSGYAACVRTHSMSLTTLRIRGVKLSGVTTIRAVSSSMGSTPNSGAKSDSKGLQPSPKASTGGGGGAISQTTSPPPVGLSRLASALPYALRLSVIDFTDTALGNRDAIILITAIAKLPNLREVYLAGCLLTDACADAVVLLVQCSVQKESSATFSQTLRSGLGGGEAAAPPTTKKQTSTAGLTVLSLSRNALSDRLLTLLSSVCLPHDRSLHTLLLDRNAFTTKGVVTLMEQGLILGAAASGVSALSFIDLSGGAGNVSHDALLAPADALRYKGGFQVRLGDAAGEQQLIISRDVTTSAARGASAVYRSSSNDVRYGNEPRAGKRLYSGLQGHPHLRHRGAMVIDGRHPSGSHEDNQYNVCDEDQRAFDEREQVDALSGGPATAIEERLMAHSSHFQQQPHYGERTVAGARVGEQSDPYQLQQPTLTPYPHPSSFHNVGGGFNRGGMPQLGAVQFQSNDGQQHMQHQPASPHVNQFYHHQPNHAFHPYSSLPQGIPMYIIPVAPWHHPLFAGCTAAAVQGGAPQQQPGCPTCGCHGASTQPQQQHQGSDSAAPPVANGDGVVANHSTTNHAEDDDGVVPVSVDALLAHAATNALNTTLDDVTGDQDVVNATDERGEEDEVPPPQQTLLETPQQLVAFEAFQQLLGMHEQHTSLELEAIRGHVQLLDHRVETLGSTLQSSLTTMQTTAAELEQERRQYEALEAQRVEWMQRHPEDEMEHDVAALIHAGIDRIRQQFFATKSDKVASTVVQPPHTSLSSLLPPRTVPPTSPSLQASRQPPNTLSAAAVAGQQQPKQAVGVSGITSQAAAPVTTAVFLSDVKARLSSLGWD
jgi:hypothetical protein